MTDPEREVHAVYNYFEQERSINTDHIAWMDSLMAHVKQCLTCASAPTYRGMCPTGKRTYDHTAEDAFTQAKDARQEEENG